MASPVSDLVEAAGTEVNPGIAVLLGNAAQDSSPLHATAFLELGTAIRTWSSAVLTGTHPSGVGSTVRVQPGYVTALALWADKCARHLLSIDTAGLQRSAGMLGFSFQPAFVLHCLLLAELIQDDKKLPQVVHESMKVVFSGDRHLSDPRRLHPVCAVLRK